MLFADFSCVSQNFWDFVRSDAKIAIFHIIPSDVLQPIKTWNNSNDYDATADNLASMFIENFKRYQQGVSEAVNASSPKPLSVN